MFEIVCYTLAGIIILGELVMAAETFVARYKANEIRKREQRADLHSPAWADTMMYWRTIDEELD